MLVVPIQASKQARGLSPSCSFLAHMGLLRAWVDANYTLVPPPSKEKDSGTEAPRCSYTAYTAMRASRAHKGARSKPLRKDARVHLPRHRTAQERRHARALPTPMTLLGHFYPSPVTLFFSAFFFGPHTNAVRGDTCDAYDTYFRRIIK